jgi:hypothetical protein
MIRSSIVREYEEQEEKVVEYGVILGDRWEIYIFGRPTPTGIISNDSSITMSYFKLNGFKDYRYSNESLVHTELLVTILKMLR